ncbi:MAG: hypothetical protein ACI8QZ_002003 [Chlamydiales bacterium]|jgi:hypothetical protein
MAQQVRIWTTNHKTHEAEQSGGQRATHERSCRRAWRGPLLTTLLMGLGASLSSAQGRFGRLPAPLLGSTPIEAPFALRPVPTGLASNLGAGATSIPYKAAFQPLLRTYQDEPAASKSSYFRAKDGVYVAGLLLRAKIGDEDFDGMGVISGGGSSEIMPTADDGTGTGWAIGIRRDNRSMEFNYTSADHEGAHVSRSGVVDSTSDTYNLDFRFHFNAQKRFQPHVLLGIGVGCLTVHGGSIGLGRQENATYTGLGANLGVGASYYATDALSVAFDLGYRLQSYASVDGVVDGSLASSASGSGGFTGFRISYTF